MLIQSRKTRNVGFLVYISIFFLIMGSFTAIIGGNATAIAAALGLGVAMIMMVLFLVKDFDKKSSSQITIRLMIVSIVIFVLMGALR